MRGRFYDYQRDYQRDYQPQIDYQTPEKRKIMKEQTIERHLARRVKEQGGLALKLPALFCAGLPDRLVLLPGGRAAFVELKAPGCRPRPLQVRMHATLRGLGFRVETIDSLDGITSFLASL